MKITNSSPSFPVNESLTTCSSPSEPIESNTELVLNDAELISILISAVNQRQNHATTQLQTPPIHDVPEFVNNNKRKRNDNNLVDSDDDEEDEFNFLDQFDFVDVSFDFPLLNESNKKQKTTNSNPIDENVNKDLLALLEQSDSLLAELDCTWGLDTVS